MFSVTIHYSEVLQDCSDLIMGKVYQALKLHHDRFLVLLDDQRSEVFNAADLDFV